MAAVRGHTLADVVGLPPERSPLRLAQTKASLLKLVTFVPEKDAERVSRALFGAGAGRIGAYTHCSFQTKGTGTFFSPPDMKRCLSLTKAQRCHEPLF